MARAKCFKPCGHRVVVLPDPVEEQSHGGIIVVTSEKQKKLDKAGKAEGTLVLVGPNAWKAFDDGTPWAKEGDRVLYAKYGGVFVTNPVDGVEYVLLNDEDIVLVTETEE